jgi:hypothetical protein
MKLSPDSFVTVIDDDGFMEIPSDILNKMSWVNGTTLYFYKRPGSTDGVTWMSDKEELITENGIVLEKIVDENNNAVTSTIVVSLLDGSPNSAKENSEKTEHELPVLSGTAVSNTQ